MTKKTLVSLFSLLIILALAIGGYWYHNRKADEPNAISAKFNPIEHTDYNSKPKKVYPLTIEFSAAAAPIDLLKKEITQGVSIEPMIKGRWEWINDRILTFTPADDWMAGQQYQVKLEDKILNPKLQYVKAVTEPKTVETPKFRANVEEYEFYQDPNQAHIRQSIVHLTFTHPVDRQKLEKAVSVNLIRKNRDATQDIIAPLNFKIRYGEYDLSAWITSDSVSLASSDNQYIQTKIDKNLTALLGHNILAEPLEEDVEVPTKFSLQLDNNIQYVNNQQNEPEQILSFEFNQSVKGVDLAKNLQTVLLPEKDEYWSYNQITQQVLDESEKITPELIPTQNHYANVQNFRINIPQQRCLYVYVKNQFSAQGGYQLPQAVGTINCAGNYPKYVGFVGEGSLLALSGDKKITIATRNFDKIQLDIGRVQEAQLRHIANLNFNTFQNPNLGNLKFDDISNFSTTIFNVPNHNPSKSYYESFDINQHNNFPGEKGIFWLKVSGLQSDGDTYTPQNKDTSNDYNWQNDSTNQYDDYRLIVLTDLGIIAKKAADGSQSVFVQSIHSGKPIAYASIKVVSRNGSAIEQAYTNTSGVAFLPSLENYKQEREPVMYLVEHNGDQSFLPIGKEDRTLNYSRFDVGGVITEQDTSGLKATLINDRGIYRPNETLHTAIITKAVDWNTKLGNIPLQLEVTSPRGNVVNKQVLSLADNGFNTFDYTLPENAESGEWMVQLYISKQDKKQTEIGSMTFQVQEFQPDTLKIKTQFNTQETLGWVSPHDLTANVHLTNLFGTPAQKRLVKANLTLHNLFPKFSQYSDYQFYDNRRNKSAILYEAELDDQYTDEQGNAKFVLDLSQYAENTAQMLYFTADGFETGSGRGVSGVNSVMVSAQPWLIGYQSKQDLNYLKQNSNADVHLIAVNSKLEKIALENLTATLFERKYVSVLTQQNSGAYKYESKLVETQKTENLINITQEGITLPLSTEQSGDFVLIITDNNKLEVNRINYSVIGNHNVSTEIAKNTELKLKLNKNQFLPGEQIEVVINAPYAGSGLITIERDRVYAHQWFKTDTNQSVQHIKLPDNFEGNGYINVQFSRDINSNDIFTSPLSYGVTPFTVNVDNHRLELTLDTPKQVKSGETIEFKLSGNKPSKAVIYAVNEGILQVAGYRLNDPLKFFFPKHALQVETLQILDLILPEFSQIMQFAKIGGDDGSQELSALAQRAKIAAENSNPFKRKVDKPVVYWSGIVDVNGEKTVRYQIPEGFNGNLKVMAIAVGDDNDTMGIVENETLVRDDIILSPTVPLVLTPGDRSQLSVSVANNTATTKNITVKVAADPQITLIGAAEKTIDVPPMTEHAVEFEVNATEVGASKLHFTASYSNDRQQSEEVMRSISLSVRPTQPKQYFTQIGKVESGKALNTSLPALLYPQQRSQAALFSPAPMVLAQGISAYLADYDNYCTEQIISSAMPALLFAKNPEYQPIFAMFSNLRQHENDLTQASEQAIQKSLNKAFDLLPSRQMENGEYGIWDNINDSNPFVTAYVAHFLIEALEHNVQRIPTAWFNEDGLFNKTMRALDQQSMPREGDSLVILRQRAYSAYLLTRLAQVPSNALISIRTQLEQNFKAQDWQTDLTAAWLAAAYKNLQQDSEAAKLIDPVVTQLLTERNTQWQYGYYYDPLIEDSSALYVIARHFPEKLEAVSDVVLARINKALNEQRYNTLSSAMVLLALDSYTQQHQANAEQLNINVNGKDISQLQGAFRLAVLDAEKADLNFINQSSQAAWFAISQSGYPQKASGQNLQNGLEIDRTYTDKNGKEISNVKIGDIINVTVKLRADRNLVPDVVITDLFPAGFEVIWQKGGEESSKDFWNPVHTDLREDRMLSYGDAKSETRYLTYQLKAVNIGTFNIPAVYAESMYDRSIKALVIGKGSIKIEK